MFRLKVEIEAVPDIFNPAEHSDGHAEY